MNSVQSQYLGSQNIEEAACARGIFGFNLNK
jgi:hypothetical protein